MVRIFSYLATFALSLTGATVAEGFGILGASQGATMHFLLGLLSALSIMLVCGVVVTWFIGTSRWCKEVVETYSLDESLVRRSTRLKRKTFPWALLSMLTMIGIIATGAASDPNNTLVAPTGIWANAHLLAATVGCAVIAASFLLQLNNIRQQHEVIGEIVAEVRRIRLERGLEV